MATYAIGDVQGCNATLQRLVEKLGFDPARDRLRFVGDLVNRGPDNLGVLRYVKGLGDRAETVLGNHDLHLISRASGLSGAKELDTLGDVLGAKDRDELVEWLAHRPLLLQEEGRVLVHAGLLPSWTPEAAAGEARRLEKLLRDSKLRPKVLAKEGFDPALKALTTIRTVKADGTLCKFSGPPAEAPPGCTPWFADPARQSRGTTVLFGHWSALGFKRGSDYLALDSGCVWGQTLTAVRLEDGHVQAQMCVDPLPRRS
jgi:bis(5'-nucleosyl)-tetraphosphatase (symmetrical)